MAVIELVVSTTAFWTATGAIFRANNPRTGDTKDNRMKEALIRLPHARVTWICALFLLGYVGIEVALGGWIVKWSAIYLSYICRHHTNAPQYVPLCFTIESS
jgi:fucose permease